MKESNLVRRMTEHLWSVPGSYVVKIHGGPYGRKGIPDVLWVHAGRATFIEAKTETGKPTKLQMFESKRILKAGATCRVIRSMIDLRALIDEVLESEKYHEAIDWIDHGTAYR